MTRATVLAYHGVGELETGRDPHNLLVSPSAFAAQMRFLAQHREVVPLSEVVGARAEDPRAVALTFDDGYRHLLRTALPVLEQHRFPATVFVPTQHIGGSNTWDPPSDSDLDIMDDDELREAERRGLLVESHGHAHVDARTTPLVRVADDLERSCARLQEVLGRRPRYLAWPFRDGPPAARDVARRLGFDAAFSIDLPHDGRYSHGRVQVTPLDSLRLFGLKTSGRYLELRYHPLARAGWATIKGAVRRRRR